jgi:putative MATE family efflux protein
MTNNQSTGSDRELFRRIWSLSWPTVLYGASEASLGFVDLLMVRSFGADATAAIGVSRQVTFLVDAVVIALATGIVTLVSQAVGAQRWDEVHKVLRQCVLLVFLLGVPTAVIGSFASGPLLSSLQASTETVAHAQPYLRVYFLGVVFNWLGVVGAAYYRGTGNAITPLKLALGVALINVPLNYLFIHGAGAVPSLGVPGAAVATVLARSCGALAYLLLLKGVARRTQPDSSVTPAQTVATVRGFDWRLIKRIFRVGTPMALTGLARNGSRLVFLSIIGAGALGMSLHAAVGVGLQVRLLSVLPALAFQVATAALVGQAIGRRDFVEAAQLGRRSVQLLALIMTLVVGSIMLLAGPIASLLIDDPTVAEVGATVLRWFAVGQFLSALNITLQGTLMGAGDTLPNLRYTLLSQWIIMLPVAYATSSIPGWELYGPLLAWILAPAILLVWIARRFLGGKWRRVAEELTIT